MSTPIWILLLLSCQSASASLFGDFYSSMTNLKDSFSTLMTDVIVDVKKTIDCTILVVEQALNLQQLDPDFARRCKGELDEKAKSDNASSTTSTEVNKTEERKKLERNLDESLSQVNKSICTMMKHRNLKSVKGALGRNTDHLFEIKILLRKELNKISDDIKKKFSIDFTRDDDASVDGVYNDLMILQAVKQMDDNNSDVREIDIVLDDVYDILKINDANDSTPKTAEDEIKLLNKDKKVIQSDSIKVNQLLNKEIKELQRDTREVVAQTPLSTTETILNHSDPTSTTNVITSTVKVTSKATTMPIITTQKTTPCATNSPTATLKSTTDASETTKHHSSKITPHPTTKLSTSVETSTTESPKTTLSPLIHGLLKVPTNDEQKAFIKQAKLMMQRKKQAEKMMNVFENGNVAPGSILDFF